MPPLITIITPTFNTAATLEKTIASVLNQKYPNLEYWIIDGGSSDGTVDVIKAHQRQLSGYISEPDKGISDAFNKGVNRAHGELVGIINAGDWYAPQALDKIAEAHQRRGDAGKSPAILHGDMMVHPPEPNTGNHPPYVNRPRLWGGKSRIGRSICFDMPINHPTCFVPRSVYQSVGVFDTSFRLAMDVDFVIRAWRAGVEFEYIPQVMAHFALGGASTTQTRPALSEVLRAQRKNGLSPGLCFASYLLKLAINRAKAACSG